MTPPLAFAGSPSPLVESPSCLLALPRLLFLTASGAVAMVAGGRTTSSSYSFSPHRILTFALLWYSLPTPLSSVPTGGRRAPVGRRVHMSNAGSALFSVRLPFLSSPAWTLRSFNPLPRPWAGTPSLPRPAFPQPRKLPPRPTPPSTNLMSRAPSACSAATSPLTSRKPSANRPCGRPLAQLARSLVLWIPFTPLSTQAQRLPHLGRPQRPMPLVTTRRHRCSTSSVPPSAPASTPLARPSMSPTARLTSATRSDCWSFATRASSPLTMF